MKDTELVFRMYREIGLADRKAICAARGFSHEAVMNDCVFVDAYLSDQGLGSVLKALSIDEIRALNLLLFASKPFDVAVFSEVYKSGTRKAWGTYNEINRPIYKHVKTSLVNSGVVILTIAKEDCSRSSVLERHEFRFPRLFESCLPLPFERILKSEESGNCHYEVLRMRINSILDQNGNSNSDRSGIVNINKGKIFVGDELFTARKLQRNLLALWDNAFGRNRNRIGLNSVSAVLLDILSRLKNDEWVCSNEVKPVLDLAFGIGAGIDAQQVMDQGWECGCLSRLSHEDELYFRPSTPDFISGTDPIVWSRVNDQDGWIEIDLSKVPIEEFELSAKISTAAVHKGMLVLKPDLPAIGRGIDSFNDNSFIQWLDKNSSVFRGAFNTVRKRRGKTIVHKGLLIAQVNDLDLKMKILSSLSNDSEKIIELSENFLAFPENTFDTVERIVLKAGFAVKVADGKMV